MVIMSTIKHTNSVERITKMSLNYLAEMLPSPISNRVKMKLKVIGVKALIKNLVFIIYQRRPEFYFADV